MMSGEERGVGEVTKQEGKGRGRTGIRKVWEDWWHVREAEWMNEEWGELSGDDLDMERREWNQSNNNGKKFGIAQ